MCSIERVLNFKLVTLVKTLNGQAESYLKEAGILYSHYGAMVVIYEHPGIMQAELAQMKATDRTTAGHTIDKLEQLSYVERRKDLADRRAFHLYLTPKGEEVVKIYWEQLKLMERQVLQNLSDSETEQLYELLDKAIKGEEEDEKVG